MEKWYDNVIAGALHDVKVTLHTKGKYKEDVPCLCKCAKLVGDDAMIVNHLVDYTREPQLEIMHSSNFK